MILVAAYDSGLIGEVLAPAYQQFIIASIMVPMQLELRSSSTDLSLARRPMIDLHSA